MLKAVDTVAARTLVTTMVGFSLALGPFDHAAVSAMHLLFCVWLSEALGQADLLVNLGLSVVGNIVGALTLITLTHTAQVKSG
jgi:formate/nitrite transporter FocA (FNT family)